MSIVDPPEQGVKTPPTELTEHTYVPSSRWTGSPNFPRWAACSECDFSGPLRASWSAVERDFSDHLREVIV